MTRARSTASSDVPPLGMDRGGRLRPLPSGWNCGSGAGSEGEEMDSKAEMPEEVVVRAKGRPEAPSRGPSSRIMARSTALRSSRTLPGQS